MSRAPMTLAALFLAVLLWPGGAWSQAEECRSPELVEAQLRAGAPGREIGFATHQGFAAAELMRQFNEADPPTEFEADTVVIGVMAGAPRAAFLMFREGCFADGKFIDATWAVEMLKAVR